MPERHPRRGRRVVRARVRPLRAGDYSVQSDWPDRPVHAPPNIPIEERGAAATTRSVAAAATSPWHTLDDLMPVADLEILRRDLMVYLTTIVRIVNAPLHPFDYAAAVDEIGRPSRTTRRPPAMRSTRSRFSTPCQGSSRISGPGGVRRTPRSGKRRTTPPSGAGSMACCGGLRGCSCRSTMRAASVSTTTRP